MIATKWVNTDPDEGALPALLLRVEARLPADSLDALWIFPTRRAASVESTVILASCLSSEPERRNVFTARFTVLRDKKGRPTVQEHLQEHATAPADAVGRVVEGVVRRLGDDAAQPPRHDVIAGDVERFDALISELGGTPPTRGPIEDSDRMGAEGVSEATVAAAAEASEGVSDSAVAADAEPAAGVSHAASPADGGVAEVGAPEGRSGGGVESAG